MKRLHGIALAVLLLTPATAAAADDRAKAAEETREALKSYRDALEQELRQLEAWSRTVSPPGGETLREERAVAKKKLEQLADEASRAWERVRARMDAVVDDVTRQHRAARAP